MTDAAPDNAHEYSVSELAGALKRTVEDAFGLVRVKGEISGLKVAASGHAYLALRDASASLDAVMWKAGFRTLAFRPEDGMEVVATGRLTTYPGRSKYQLLIDRLEVAGVGALLQQLEARKARLRAEGLFDDPRKQPIPYLPQVIGVITSPTGAVIRDILHRLADRFPRHVLIWPVQVQGEAAAAQVAAAIRGFDAIAEGAACPRPDLLIVARGGGSIEDLWPFNEEEVVRAVAACQIPLISAVGHETDWTLIDFVADRRAPTPTAAAEMAVPVRAELAEAVKELVLRMMRAERRSRALRTERVQALGERLPTPAMLVAQRQQRLDDLAERLPRALIACAARWRARLGADAGALRPALLAQLLRVKRQQLEALAARLPPALDRRRAAHTATLQRLSASLAALSPELVLARGYALVEARRGGVVTSADAARAAQALTLRFARGTVDVAVDDGPGGATRAPVATGAPRSARARGRKDEDQGNLL